MATVKRAAILSAVIIAVTALTGCWFFMDPAAPPFDDRIAVTRAVDDLFANLRDAGIDMNVVDNGSRYFLLVSGPGIGGDARTVAFTPGLQIVMNRLVMGDVRTAFPDAAGDFVIGTTGFDGATFELSAVDLFPWPDAPHVVVPGSGSNGIVQVQDYTGFFAAGIGVSARYDDSWANPDAPDPPPASPVYGVAVEPQSEPPVPLDNFELISAQHHRPTSGIVLYNKNVNRVFVVEVPSAIADEPWPVSNYIDTAYPEARVVSLTAGSDERVFYTRRGVVVVTHDGHHEVYSMAGKRIAEYRPDDQHDYEFAYSPDGRWVFILDRARRRLYRASAWW